MKSLPKMAGSARQMLRKSLDAVANMNARLARDVLAADENVETSHPELTDKFRPAMREDGTRIDALPPIMFISKYIERRAGLATSFAEDANDMAATARSRVTYDTT